MPMSDLLPDASEATSRKRCASRAGGWRRAWAFAVLCALLAGVPAAADEYDPTEAGHPLRILAYAVHPVGVILDVLIFRPAHWVGSLPVLDKFFGHEKYDD
jgi:hypothetical protein